MNPLRPCHHGLGRQSLLSICLLLSTSLLLAENWPQFRGPTGQGISIEKDVPLKWSATENVVWKTPIPGESWSSPIIWGERVFVTTATENGESCRILSLDRQTGRILWDKELFRQEPGHKQQRNTFATPTPATDGVGVYACFGDGSFGAVSFSGELLWTNRGYPFYGEHGLGSSPILYRDLIIMARDGSGGGEDKSLGWQKPWDQAYVLALDTRTGQERWKGRRGLSRISHGVPTIWEHDGRAEVVSEAGDVLQGFDAGTGERLWSSEVIGEGKVPSVVLGEGMAFTSGGWGGKESIKGFRLGGRGDLKETNLVWQQKKGMPKVPSMLYVKPYLFAVSDAGVAACMKAATGEIVWQERIGGNFSASPVSVEGRIYFTGDNGETTVIEAGPEFKILANNPLGEKVQASPAFSQGQIFIRSEKNLFCISDGFPARVGTIPGPTDGLLAHWKFDEADGATVNDSSNAQLHGILRGALRVVGKSGHAIVCAQDALVEVPHTAALDDFKRGLSVAAWVKRDADATWNMIISREVKDGPSEYFGLAVFKNKALFSVDGDGAHYKNIQGTEEMPVGEWIHLAGTYDHHEMKLYVNGKLVKSAPYSTPFEFADTNPVIIGGNTNNQGKKWVDCFHGVIDDVQLFNRALSDEEMRELCRQADGVSR
jgi:outer membrane protein assembly factor BamB